MWTISWLIEMVSFTLNGKDTGGFQSSPLRGSTSRMKIDPDPWHRAGANHERRRECE